MNKSFLKKNNDINQKYGFFNPLNKDFPSQVIIDITELCNLSCVHCSHASFKKSSIYKAASLNVELSAKMVDEVKSVGKNITKYIRFCAEGEPFMHKNLFDMLEYAVLNSGITVSLTTNGTLMNEKNIEKLLTIGIGVIDLSIDAFTAETYAKIRRGGNLEITRSNVLKLIEMKNQVLSTTKIVVSFIEQKENINEKNDFELFWKDNGVDYVAFRKLHSNSGAIIEIANNLRNSIVKKRSPCVYPWERIVLNPRGFLSFCPADWKHESTIPNADYRFVSVAEVWKSKFYEKLREAHILNNFENYVFCGRCPDWSVTRWPNEGQSYSKMVSDLKG